MAPARSDARSTATVAMVCSGIIGAQYVGALATRDTLFLATMDAAARPAMVALAGGLSILLIALNWRLMTRVSPAAMVPGAFAVNALLLAVDWALVSPFPRFAAQAFFLQTNAVGPLLGSGFWLIVSEHLDDPRTAKTYFGRIAAVGTLGGLGGAFVAARVADVFGVGAMLPALAVLNLVGGWQIRRFAHRAVGGNRHTVADRGALAGFGGLAAAPYIQILAALLLLGAMGSSFVEHLMNVEAQKTLAPDALPRFFSIYYGGVGVLVFGVQTALGSLAINRLGLTLTMISPSLALAVGGLGALLFPGLAAVTGAYGSESVLYQSLSRKAYEVFFTPVPTLEKRSIKAIVDVVPHRVGFAVSSGLIALLTVWWPERLYAGLLFAAIACSGLALVLARRLNHEYVRTLERNLLSRRVDLELADVVDTTTRTVLLRTLHTGSAASARRASATESQPAVAKIAVADPETQAILVLRSGDRERILTVLRNEESLPHSVVHHVIPLLADAAVAEEAIRALRKVAEGHVGELVDALIDPNQPFAVRRRLARVFSICTSQRAADGLLLGLEDLRFEVRFQCGRSLVAVREKSPLLRIPPDSLFDVVRREAAVGGPVWQSRQLLDTMNDDRSFVDEFVRDRASQSLAHVFTLLSLVLPSAPLQVAYRGLHMDDPGLRGTALEYLESVLPADIRGRLWPFLGDGPVRSQQVRPREEILADLLRSHEGIVRNLEELRRRVPQK